MGETGGPINSTEFLAGDARPVHLVHVDAFCIDMYEVTLERHEDCVDAGVCSPASRFVGYLPAQRPISTSYTRITTSRTWRR